MGEVKSAAPGCTVFLCGGRHYSAGLCRKHWLRDPTNQKPCGHPGCERAAVYARLCRPHYHVHLKNRPEEERRRRGHCTECWLASAADPCALCVYEKKNGCYPLTEDVECVAELLRVIFGSGRSQRVYQGRVRGR